MEDKLNDDLKVKIEIITNYLSKLESVIYEKYKNLRDEEIEKNSFDDIINKLGKVFVDADEVYTNLKEYLENIDANKDKEEVISNVVDKIYNSLNNLAYAYTYAKKGKDEWLFNWLEAVDSIKDAKKMMDEYL